MADTAAHLVDEVLPDVPVRPFVLSLPPNVRILCAFRPDAVSLTISACELNVHLHSIVLDGVYVDESDGRIVDPDRARPATDPAWFGSVAGFNLHAGVALSALDREGRERLCKYLLRPPVSDDRLSLREDGRFGLQLKTPWRDGTVALLFTPEQFVARLAALVPRPGKNLVRYHGMLAPKARGRADIVPPARPAREAAAEPPEAPTAPPPPKARAGRYLLWHELLRRVFEIDVLECPNCGGRLRLLCTVHEGISARRDLQGASAQAPPAEARPPPAPARTASA